MGTWSTGALFCADAVHGREEAPACRRRALARCGPACRQTSPPTSRGPPARTSRKRGSIPIAAPCSTRVPAAGFPVGDRESRRRDRDTRHRDHRALRREGRIDFIATHSIWSTEPTQGRVKCRSPPSFGAVRRGSRLADRAASVFYTGGQALDDNRPHPRFPHVLLAGWSTGQSAARVSTSTSRIWVTCGNRANPLAGRAWHGGRGRWMLGTSRTNTERGSTLAVLTGGRHGSTRSGDAPRRPAVEAEHYATTWT